MNLWSNFFEPPGLFLVLGSDSLPGADFQGGKYSGYGDDDLRDLLERLGHVRIARPG